jgi:hypothetical protein
VLHRAKSSISNVIAPQTLLAVAFPPPRCFRGAVLLMLLPSNPGAEKFLAALAHLSKFHVAGGESFKFPVKLASSSRMSLTFF